MPRLDIAVPDRFGIALRHVIEGDVAGTGRALLAPDTLTPKEREDLIEKWWGPGESAVKSAARFLTNPLTIGAMALAVRWPAPSMHLFQPTVKSLLKYDKHIPGLLRKLSGLFEIFHGTGIDDAAIYLTRERGAFANKYLGPGLGAGLDEFVAATGSLPSPARQAAMGFAWDMSQPGYRDKLLGFLNGQLKKAGVSTRLTADDLAIQTPLSAAEQKLMERTRDITVKPMYSVLKEAEEVGVLGDLQRDMQYQSAAVRFDEPVKRAMRTARKKLYGKPGKLPPEIENYYPHIVARDPVTIRAGYEALGSEILGTRAKARQTLAATDAMSATAVLERHHRMVPNLKQLRKLADAGVVSPKLANTLEGLQDHLVTHKLTPMQEYDLRMVHAVSHHADALGRSYIWRVKRDRYVEGLGTYMKNRTNELASGTFDAKRNAQLLLDTYIPSMLGRSTVEQYHKGLEWGAMREWTAKKLTEPGVQKVLGPKLTNTLTEMVHYGTGLATWHGAGGRLASWFYLSTLGFNPATAAQNLLQTFLTTGAVVKPKYMVEALEETWRGFGKMHRLMRDGMTEAEAIQSVFPDFARQGLTLEGMSHEAIAGAQEIVPGVTRAALQERGFAGGVRRFSDVAMRMFSKTERFNQLLAFNGAHKQAIAEGLKADAGEIAAKVTKLTQQWSGPYSVPSGLQNLWAPLRQFTTFPAKTAAFLGLSAANAVGLGPGGMFNPGTLGRAVIGSMGAYEFGRAALGTDLSSSLIFGAMPKPSERGPFAPLPIVPPALAIGGAAAMDLARGRIEELPRAIPLGIPAGVAAARALPLLGGYVHSELSSVPAGVFGRPYADYSKSAMGQVPVYTAEGALQGNFTPFQIIQRAIGVGGDQFKDESELVRYITAQRDAIRDYRRRYIDARMTNDPRGAEDVSREYEERFGLGPIQVKDSDLRSWKIRNQMTRLQRLMRTLPQESRAMYGAIASTALANYIPASPI